MKTWGSLCGCSMDYVPKQLITGSQRWMTMAAEQQDRSIVHSPYQQEHKLIAKIVFPYSTILRVLFFPQTLESLQM